MSRKIILTLATAATITASALASSAADARGFGGGGGMGHVAGIGRVGGAGSVGRVGGIGRIGGFGFGRIGGIHRVAGGPFPILLPPGRHGPGLPPPWWLHHHHHWHWWFRDGRWVTVEDGMVEPVVAPGVAPLATPGPCTCLTKSYTQDGLVVFADLCTKESAAAPVNGRAADATPAPQGPSAPPAPPAEDKTSDATPTQNPSNFAGRTYQDFLAANGLPLPQGTQRN